MTGRISSHRSSERSLGYGMRWLLKGRGHTLDEIAETGILKTSLHRYLTAGQAAQEM